MFQFRNALASDEVAIWEIIQFAIHRRKLDGSNQWQDGYPNVVTIQNDIKKQQGFVLTFNTIIVGYCAILINNEPEYQKIIGKWLTNQDFVVVHRIAIHQNYLGKNLSKTILEFVENYAKKNHIFSIKLDTNFDNIAMLKIFEKLEYTYCGEVYFRGSPRKAFEKIIR